MILSAFNGFLGNIMVFGQKNRGEDHFKKQNFVKEVANTFELLVTAFLLAIIFRAFIIEPYLVPTGSMAETLMGAHFRLHCTQCGYQYDYGFDPSRYGLAEHYVTGVHLNTYPSKCPSCGFHQPAGGDMTVTNGDRILVLKSIYQFFKPNRWDVIVFKNPLDPQLNYVKRLVAKPNETVEIIDGDIYINGQVTRKPPKLQHQMWMVVYDNDYQPARPNEPAFNGHTWRSPFDLNNSKWRSCKNKSGKFFLDTDQKDIQILKYNTELGNDFRANCAYNDLEENATAPYCSDLMVKFHIDAAKNTGLIGAVLSKYDRHYKAWLDIQTSEMVITETDDNNDIELARKKIDFDVTDKITSFQFANVDHQLTLKVNSEQLAYDLGRFPFSAGKTNHNVTPEVKIFGAGKLSLAHIGIFRDIYYTQTHSYGPNRAKRNNPFKLKEDEFFVLGDNSANSADSRYWNRAGLANNGLSYRAGIVPRDYLVGKALLVYWPAGFKLLDSFSIGVVPAISKIRFIYGGSGKGI